MSHALPREWFGTSIRNDSLKREKAPFRARSILAYLAAASVPLGALLFYIWLGVHVIRNGYEIDQLRHDHQTFQAERDRLKVELASLQNLDVVETLALRDLDMVYPEPGQVVVVREVSAGPALPRDPSSAEERAAPKDKLLVFLRKVTEAM